MFAADRHQSLDVCQKVARKGVGGGRMNDVQWQRAWEIYDAAARLDGGERQSFLISQDTDPAVLDEVRSMLQEADAPPGNQHASRTGSRYGRYEVGELLGSGGMGEVYAAHDQDLGRRVAIKFLNWEMARSQRPVERLIREAKAASALNHPHIITVYEVIRESQDV